MKRILLSAAVFAFSATAFAQTKIVDVAKFANETIDFGKIKQGVPQKGTFTVTNGNQPPLHLQMIVSQSGNTIHDMVIDPGYATTAEAERIRIPQK